jgi:hypothetical protein
MLHAGHFVAEQLLLLEAARQKALDFVLALACCGAVRPAALQPAAREAPAAFVAGAAPLPLELVLHCGGGGHTIAGCTGRCQACAELPAQAGEPFCMEVIGICAMLSSLAPFPGL